MAITLKYGAPGPMLAAGFAAGVGNRQNKLRDQGLKQWEQEQQRIFDAKKQEDVQAFQAARQEDVQEFQQGLAQQGIDARAQESRLDREQRWAQEREHKAFLIEQNTMMGLRRGELQLPPDAEKQLRGLEGDQVAAMELDPVSRDEFQEYYEKEKRKLLGLARPTNELSYDERLKKGLGANYEQYKNLPWQFNTQGEMSLPSGFKMPGDEQGKAAEQQAKAAQEFREGVVKRYEKLRGEVNQQTGQPISDAEAQKQAIAEQMQVEQFRQSLSGGGAQAPAAVPRIGGPVAAPAGQPAAPAANPAGAPGSQPSASPAAQASAAPVASRDPAIDVQPPAKSDLPLGNVISAAVSAGYTPVRTPNEAKTLKSGTKFILPDGRTGTRK